MIKHTGVNIILNFNLKQINDVKRDLQEG